MRMKKWLQRGIAAGISAILLCAQPFECIAYSEEIEEPLILEMELPETETQSSSIDSGWSGTDAAPELAIDETEVKGSVAAENETEAQSGTESELV